MENARLRLGIVTFLLVGGTLAAFGLIKPSGGDVPVETLVACGALERGRIWDGEYWRFLAYMFLHPGWESLIWNCLVLPAWCLPIERREGPAKFLVAYLLSGLGAGAVMLLGRDDVWCGLPGAALGIVGVWFGTARRADLTGDASLRRTMVFVVVWCVVCAMVAPASAFALGGGLGFGLLFGWAFRVPRPARRAACVGGLVVLAAFAAGMPWPGMKASRSGREAALAGHEAWKASDSAGAVRQFTRAEKFGHRDRALHLDRGRAYYKLGDFTRASADFDAAVGWGDDDRSARLLRGWARLRTNDAKGALADFNECAEFDPKNTSALVGRGAACLVMGEHDAALANLDDALRLDDGLHEAYYYRATAHHQRGRRDKAIDDYERALAKAPSDWAARADAERKLESLRKEKR